MKGHEIALVWKLQDGVSLESQSHLLVGGESSPQACTCLRRRHPGCYAFPRIKDPLVPAATWAGPAAPELRQLRISVVGINGLAEFTVSGRPLPVQVRGGCACVAVPSATRTWLLHNSHKLERPGQSPGLDAKNPSSSLWLRVSKKPVRVDQTQ